jgi:hypothetical protein
MFGHLCEYTIEQYISPQAFLRRAFIKKHFQKYIVSFVLLQRKDAFTETTKLFA